MANTTTRPSAVLGEYLSDVQRFWDLTERTPSGTQKDSRETLEASLQHGFARTLKRWYGEDIVWDYWRGLNKRAEAQRQADAKANYGRWLAERRAQQGAKVETSPPKRRGRKPRRQSAEARDHDRKLRTAMYAWRNERNRVNRGLRRLGQDAGVSEASVRRALKFWEGDGQITRNVWHRGKTQSIQLHLEHPAWSDVKASHPRSV
jgi:hypothetical protein